MNNFISKKYGFSEEELKEIGDRYTECVYCRKTLDNSHTEKARSDWATIEHLSEKEPFRKNKGLKKEGLVICCWSCNSSRGIKKLRKWFEKPYCTDPKRNINEKTVAKVVKEYIRKHEQ